MVAALYGVGVFGADGLGVPVAEDDAGLFGFFEEVFWVWGLDGVAKVAGAGGEVLMEGLFVEDGDFLAVFNKFWEFLPLVEKLAGEDVGEGVGWDFALSFFFAVG